MADRFKIGIDVGGTFTDFFLWSLSGEVETSKVLSTPADPSAGVLDGLATIARSKKTTLETFVRRIDTIVHGTTVTTNAVLTRGGAKTALLTTEGVRDALEMRRGIREERYDNRCTNVVPLVPRHLRRPIGGRLDGRGCELSPLDLEGLRSEVRGLAKEGVQAVALCFMNSFANPAHEQAALRLVGDELEGVYASASIDVLPVVRFYPRVSTTVLNAYVGPVLDEYLKRLTTRLEETGFEGLLLIMHSGGGVSMPAAARRLPVSTLLSGPAAGPKAAVAFTELHDQPDCVLVDMGGTSFDASLVRGGKAETTTEGEIDRLRIALPMLAITTIGAGGGSIGWIDQGGLLRMGPQSAGADPGPACYGRGGDQPTCTDANVVLGYLDPAFFAGGKIPLDSAAAHKAIETRVAAPLGLGLEEAAAGMYRVININMAHGVRAVTVERGLDPREFPLVAAGGAGPLHACMIARELEIPTVLIPSTASILCATGMLLSDLEHDFLRSFICPLEQLDPADLAALVQEMVTRGEEQLRQEGIPKGRIAHHLALELRYLKQYHEVTLPIARAMIDGGDLDAIGLAFHAEHNRLYGYDLQAEGTGLELINVRLRSVGRTEKPALPRLEPGGADPASALKTGRRAFQPEQGVFAEIPVYDGQRLRAGNEIAGPALVEREDTTVFVSCSFTALVDELGSLTMRSVKGVRET